MEQPTPQGSVVRWGHWAPLLSISDRQPPFLGGGHRARPHLHSGPGPGWLTALLGASTGWGWPWRGRAPPRAWPCCPVPGGGPWPAAALGLGVPGGKAWSQSDLQSPHAKRALGAAERLLSHFATPCTPRRTPGWPSGPCFLDGRAAGLGAAPRTCPSSGLPACPHIVSPGEPPKLPP